MKLLQHPTFIYLTNLHLSNHHEETSDFVYKVKQSKPKI